MFYRWLSRLYLVTTWLSSLHRFGSWRYTIILCAKSCIQLDKAVFSANLRTLEAISILAETDALNLGLLLVLIDKLQENTSLCKFILELLPTISAFQGIRFCKDGYSFKGTQISREYSFVKLNARLEGTENLLSARAKFAQQYEQGNHKNNQEPSISESSQDPWDGISSIGLFAPANAQTFESFPEAESAKKKKKKRRNGFSL